MLKDSSRVSQVPSTEQVDMRAADFVGLYKNEQYSDKFDAGITAFIDTAPDLIRYIETIRHCLKPGGV